MARGILLTVAVAALVVGVAPAAWAHAFLEESTPADGSEVASAPPQVTLRFSESVQVNSDGVSVLTSAGARVDDHDAHLGAAGDQVLVTLRPDLGRGTYLVSWHVISSDTHPVSGGFSFGVGMAPAAVAPSGGVSAVDAAQAVSRGLVYLGLVLTVGGGFFLLAVWPAGRVRRGCRRLVWAGVAALGAGTVGEFLLAGPESVGGGLGQALSPALLGATFGTPLGYLLAIRAVVVVLAGVTVPATLRAKDPPRLEAALLGLALIGTVVWAGHAHTTAPVWVSLASWSVHLAAMTVWLGGLAMLAGEALPARRDDPARLALARALPRWSRIAQGAVAALVVTGAYQTWRQVGTLPALTATGYGRALLIKLMLVGGMLVAALMSYRLVHGRLARARRPDPDLLGPDVAVVGAGLPLPRPRPTIRPRRRPATTPLATSPPVPRLVPALRRSVAVEAGLGVAVLAVTSVLVAQRPAREVYAPAFHDSVPVYPYTADITVDPTLHGRETVRLRLLDRAQKPVDVAEARARLDLPPRGLGPLTCTLRAAGEHVYACPILVPEPGQWELRLTVRVGQLDSYLTSSVVNVR